MTPEELGSRLLELRDAGQLTRGKGSELVDEAHSESKRARWLRELRRRLNALDFSAGLAERTTRLELLADERVLIRIVDVKEWLETCPLEMPKREIKPQPVPAEVPTDPVSFPALVLVSERKNEPKN